ncbi:MAG: cation diffusion facilitator family transporter [Actinobacteria bacterium]|nr:cation diffusion facilitator family transporter [Actinomycetota bacterium]
MHVHEKPNSGTKLGAALVSVLVNIFLIALKVVAGVLTGSIGILAEATHSLLDLVASLLAYLGIRWAERPADETHAFGHEKFENMSSWVQMLLLGGTCIVIVYESVRRLIEGFEIQVTWYALAVMIIAIAVDFRTSHFLHASAHRAGGSAALEADALHFISDMWGALAVVAGLALAALGIKVADPIAAIMVALIIGATAVRSGLRTASILLDKSPDEQLLEQIRELAKGHPEVVNFHSLRARQAGSKVLLDLCIELDEGTSLGQAHDISHELAEEIKKKIPAVSDALIHAEPACPHGELDEQH